MTYGSCQRMCESNVQACEKPSSSARFVSSTIRLAGGSVWDVTPKSTRSPPSRGRGVPRGALRTHQPQGDDARPDAHEALQGDRDDPDAGGDHPAGAERDLARREVREVVRRRDDVG